MKKRMLSLLLALVLVLTVTPLVTVEAVTDSSSHMKDGYICAWSNDAEEWDDYDGWWYNDLDDDNNSWEWSVDTNNPIGYMGSHGVYSQSYLNDYGQLYPDNWLYTSEFYVEPGAIFSFMIGCRDWDVPGDKVGVYVCTGNPVFEDDLHKYKLGDVWTGSDWQEIVYGLSSYEGQIVRMGFRHYDCTDCFGVVLDNFNLWYPDGMFDSVIGRHSDWAGPELSDALDLGLIPECLQGVDLTRNITRAEFAALAVRLYEVQGGVSAPYVSEDLFWDTDNQQVLQAAVLGIVNGLGNGQFGPYNLLTREQASTMLGRAYLSAIGEDMVEYVTPAPFRDDYKISDWARDAVYFMVSYGVLTGTGNGRFEPQNSCTREQGICIAARALYELPA